MTTLNKLILSEYQGIKFTAGVHLVIGKSCVDNDHMIISMLDERKVATRSIDCVHDGDRFLLSSCKDKLHPSSIREWFDKIDRDDQWFISTMNPAVIDCVYFNSAEYFQNHIFVADGKKLIQYTKELSKDFYASYVVGFQSVSELLLCKGLW